VAECLLKHWQSVADYPVPYGDVLMCNTFSSDYNPSALDSNGWTQSESSVLQSLPVLYLMMTVFLLLLPMEPRLAPLLWGGQIGILVTL
jgi:hypothetical protein